MELRHLRYFVAVAELGSFTRAAEERLHTAQPSLSRQIRDLEQELGVTLITRGPRELALTEAGQVFLDHARSILMQAASAIEATRRAARPSKTPFVIGFLTGYELEWLPRVLEILRNEIAGIELTIHSASSPELMQALGEGKMDAAFLRPDEATPGLAFRLIAREALFVLLPADHALAAQSSIRLDQLVQEPFISFPERYAPALRRLIDDYVARSGLAIVPRHEAETLPMVISLALSTGGVSLMPDYARRLLPASVVSRPLAGEAPTIGLAIGYRRDNRSALLDRFLSEAETRIRQLFPA